MQGQVPNSQKIPVTVLTGFLGSGKTTLLNHILTANHGKKICVIENEFGDVGIDDDLLKKNIKEFTGEDVIEMMNGCVCCTVRQDLITVIKKLAKQVQSGKKKFDAIVIETTGLADPAPVAQTFFVDEEVQKFAKLDGIVTMVDVKHIIQHLDAKKPEGVENEAVEQVAFADRLIMNKCDLVTDEKELKKIEDRLRDINKFAKISRSTYSKVSVEQVLQIGAFDLQRTLKMDPEFLNVDGEHEHDTTVTSLGVDVDGECDLQLLTKWLGELLNEKGPDMYRMKGILAVQGNPRKYQYHAVHMLFAGTYAEPWGNEKRNCRLTFIGKNLNHDALRTQFYRCMATEKNRAKRIAGLRFAIGDEVECLTGYDQWSRGRIAGLMWVTASGQTMPYQIALQTGGFTYAPADDNQIVRRPVQGWQNRKQKRQMYQNERQAKVQRQ